jgi:hypothetical protein
MKVAAVFLNTNKYFLSRLFWDVLQLLMPDKAICNLLRFEDFF